MDSTTHGSEADEQATREQPRVEGGAAVPPVQDPLPERDPFAERPEYYVGAAFVGGLLAAQILRRFGR